MSGLSSVADVVHKEPPTLRKICLKIAPKVRQLEKQLHRSQAHVDRLCLNFTRWYYVAPGKMRNCQNPLRAEWRTTPKFLIYGPRGLYLWNGTS